MATTQCRECPWRDMDTMPDYAVNHAKNGNTDGFICHTRCGPCPGPELALSPRVPTASTPAPSAPPQAGVRILDLLEEQP